MTARQAFSLELIATFFLTFVVFATAVDPDAPRVGGFAIGLTYGANILAIGSFSGGSMNPARSLGPAVASGIFEGQAVYWAGTGRRRDHRGRAVQPAVTATRAGASAARRRARRGAAAGDGATATSCTSAKEAVTC